MKAIPSPRRAPGFTLTEIVIGVAILSVLVAIAVPAYERYRERARVSIAVGDIGALSVSISHYQLDSRELPPGLNVLGIGKLVDPWGRPYEYLRLSDSKGNGQARKDKKLAPLNSDFDLYSVGKDGVTAAPLSAKRARDDVVRARDGKFIGLATDFDP